MPREVSVVDRAAPAPAVVLWTCDKGRSLDVLALVTDGAPHMPATRAVVPTPEERAAELAATEREVRRQVRPVYARAVVLCLAWMVSGLALVGWAVHTTDESSGLIAFWGGSSSGISGPSSP